MQKDVFCGFVSHLNLWVYGSLLRCGAQRQIVSGDIAWVVSPESIGQWTGAYDADGNKVFAPAVAMERN